MKIDETHTLQPAPIGKRFIAFFLDFMIIAGYLVVLLGVGLSVSLIGGQVELGTLTPPVMDLVAFLLAVLPVILYFTLQEGSPAQATWGKRRVGIRLAAVGGGPLGYRRPLVRSLVKFAPWQLAHTSLFHVPGWPAAPETPTTLVTAGMVAAQGLVVLYVVLMVLTRKHRTPYDWVSGAIVTVSNE